MNTQRMVGCVALIAALAAVSAALAEPWPAGNPVNITSEMTVETSAPQGPLAHFINNGSLTLLNGGSVTLTGGVHTAVGQGTGEAGTLDMQTGSRINCLGGGFFVVGLLGGSGTMDIASGATVSVKEYFSLARNNDDSTRTLNPSGFVTVSGTLIASNRLEFTGYFPTNTAIQPSYPLSARLTLEEGGEVMAGDIAKNDHASSEFIFNGGTLRAIRNHADFIGGRGVMDVIIADGKAAIFDTDGRDIVIRQHGAPYTNSLTIRGENGPGAIGNGGFTKEGAGSLVFRLPAMCNTFTGAVTVLAGTLDLGRPLAENQTVTVHPGATFVPNGAGDIGKIIGERTTYTVIANTDGLDLVSLNDTFFDDRLGGPFSNDPTYTLSNTVDYAAGDSAATPFRLIGNGGQLNITNTGLESAFLQIEGPGTFNFLGSRTYTEADIGTLAITDGGYRQANDFFLGDGSETAPLALALTNGRFNVGGTLHVGGSLGGLFSADGATIAMNALKIGAVGGSGTVTQSAGNFTANADVIVGEDGGFGDLTVTGGLFAVGNNIRIAGNSNADNRPLPTVGTVTVSNAILRCVALNFTPYRLTDGSTREIDAGLMNLLPGGVAEITYFNKNDDPISTVRFAGGKVRARQSHGTFANVSQAYGTLRFYAEAGHAITLDTQGHTIDLTAHAGTLAFTGLGGLTKQGTGMMVYGPDRSDYQGDTVIEAGTIRLGAANLIPDGSAAGNLRIAAGAALDLYGRAETVNGLTCAGRVINTNAPVAFGVLADGSDGTLDCPSMFHGEVALEKLGGGTLTLGASHIVTSNLTVRAGTVSVAPAQGFPYYRFKLEGVNSSANAVQLSEIALYDGDTDVTPSRTGVAFDPTGGANAYPNNERPEFAVDGNTATKWLDFRILPGRPTEERNRAWLRIDFPTAQRVTRYNWATANDHPERSPTAWRLQASHDAETWIDLDIQSDYTAPTTTFTWVKPGGFTVNSANTLQDAIDDTATVTLHSGAALVLDGVSETFAGLTGGGTLAITNADLTLSVPDGAEVFFSGDATGNGGIVKDGPGTQVLSGVNDYTGPTTVRAGTLSIRDTFRFFRFTVKANIGNTNVTQFSEFALYDAIGARLNLGLASVTNVPFLLSGQATTPVPYVTGSGTESPDKVFDGGTGTKWCLTGNFHDPANPATWRVLIMRLADDAPEVTSYNLCTANDTPARDPSAWTLEGSVDGATWVLLDDRPSVIPPNVGNGTNTGDGTVSTSNNGRFLWYNGGTPYTLDTARAMCEPNAIPAGSTVQVLNGAILDMQAPGAICNLLIDMQDVGAITRLIPEPGGILHIVNAGGLPANGLILPLRVDSVLNPQDLASWTVYIDGVMQKGVSLGLNPDGRLFLRAKGMILMLR